MQRRVARKALMAAAIFAVMVATGCASRQAAGPREYLDEHTAATITVAGENMVFAYDRPELGVNARDYVTLTAVDVNTSGRHALHLVGFAWSTLDKRGVTEGEVATKSWPTTGPCHCRRCRKGSVRSA